MIPSQVFLPNFGSDIGLTLMLKSWELKSFLFLLDFASTCRDPWVIPASRRTRLRLAMKMGRDEEKFAKRLAVFAGDVDLIELRVDGSIFVKYLAEQADGDESDDDDASYLSGSNADAAGNGNGTGTAWQPRQPGRRYSDNPEAVRKREGRLGFNRRGGNGGSSSSGDYASNGDNGGGTENANVPANVPSFESKRPTPHADITPQMSHIMSGAARDISPANVPDTPPTRAPISESIPDLGDNYVISSSGIDSVAEMSQTSANVPGQNVPMSHGGLVSPPPGSAPATGLPLAAPKRPPAPENPALVPELARIRRNSAVGDVMKFTGDSAEARDLWLKLWNICDGSAQLPVWDEAIRLLAKEIKQGHQPVKSRGAWLQSKLRRLLEAKDVFVPTRAELEEESADSIRGKIQASLGKVTPLDQVYDPADVTDAAVGDFQEEAE